MAQFHVCSWSYVCVYLIAALSNNYSWTTTGVALTQRSFYSTLQNSKILKKWTWQNSHWGQLKFSWKKTRGTNSHWCINECRCLSSYVCFLAVHRLEIQQGATADTQTLWPAGSNPFWKRPSTNIGPYVWGSTRTLLCYFKWAREMKTFCQPLVPCNRISHQVILRAEMRNLRRRTRTHTHACWHVHTRTHTHTHTHASV